MKDILQKTIIIGLFFCLFAVISYASWQNNTSIITQEFASIDTDTDTNLGDVLYADFRTTLPTVNYTIVFEMNSFIINASDERYNPVGYVERTCHITDKTRKNTTGYCKYQITYTNYGYDFTDYNSIKDARKAVESHLGIDVSILGQKRQIAYSIEGR